ncbi:P-loop containing nucleoside triphosphate hydrolase protein [Biscogniauxia sp. FL1348]|nr:P-loop containing nucleoside triphosphate hydrolase protein [Biscogniauxia sp. FL1348]
MLHWLKAGALPRHYQHNRQKDILPKTPKMASFVQPSYRNIVFVLGPPGSGKGTLCKLATSYLEVSRCRYQHLSVGDYLRELSASELPCEAGGFDGNMISESIRSNKLLPSQALIPLLEHKISSAMAHSQTTTVWLIDGFPRNMETALVFEEKIGKPAKVVVLECTHDIAQRRYLGRARETIDDVNRFEKRYSDYVENMNAIREHYRGAIETVCVDGSRDECFGKFVAVLSPTAAELDNK